MPRFNINEAEHYGNGGNTSYFSLKNDKDTARVRFMYRTLEDVEGFAVHEVEVDGRKRYVNCLRDYNSPVSDCPLCASGNFQKAKMFLVLYNEDTKQVQLWERGKKFNSQLLAAFSRYCDPHNIVGQVFEIERNGAPRSTQTTYGIYPMGQPDDTRLEDLPEVPDILGTIVLNKSASEMSQFINSDDRQSATNTSEYRRRPPVNNDRY